jgi:hypothetical protein
MARLLGLPVSAVTLDRPVTSFGLDSLMAIQLKNRVETSLGVSLSIVTLLEGLSLSEIAGKLSEETGGHERNGDTHHNGDGRNGTPHPALAEPHTNGHAPAETLLLSATVDDLGDLSEWEVDEMIDDLISHEDELDN